MNHVIEALEVSSSVAIPPMKVSIYGCQSLRTDNAESGLNDLSCGRSRTAGIHIVDSEL